MNFQLLVLSILPAIVVIFASVYAARNRALPVCIGGILGGVWVIGPLLLLIFRSQNPANQHTAELLLFELGGAMGACAALALRFIVKNRSAC